MKKKILTVLIVLLLAVIWGNSVLPPNTSYKVSRVVTKAVNAELQQISSGKTEGKIIDNFQIRKLAHFAEYALLGLLLLLRLRAGSVPAGRSAAFLGGAGFGAAFLDETIQMFSGRNDAILDVWLDMAGFLFGVLVTLALVRLCTRRRKT